MAARRLSATQTAAQMPRAGIAAGPFACRADGRDVQFAIQKNTAAMRLVSSVSPQ